MKQRIISGVLFGGFFIGMTVLGSWYYMTILFLLAMAAYYEFVRMIGLKQTHGAALVGYVMTAFIFLQLLSVVSGQVTFEISLRYILWPGMFLLLAMTVFTKNRFTIDQASYLFLGTLYIGFGFYAMGYVRLGETAGLYTTLAAFAAIWGSDAGAYFVGRALGKHKLWPAISPNKTVEGSIGGVVTALVIALIFWWISPDVMPLWRILCIGLASAVVGQMGDLIQSAYKRVRGVKDSGNLIPGHGGALDRTDSWLMVFPFLVLTQLLPL
jgi:phosphatidate cytidylyltransferase